jgi:hypothetical protein
MSCTNTADHALVVAAPATRIPLRWPAVIEIIVAIHDAFLEALEMRRAAHRRHRLSDE